MGDPVAWLLIDRGWSVVGSDGETLGDVDEIVGDTGKDIFSALSVSTGVLRHRKYVPSELVGLIEEGTVHLTIGSDEFKNLDAHEEPPPSQQLRPD